MYNVVFISYRHADGADVSNAIHEEAVARVRSLAPVFIDQGGIGAGDQFLETIRDHLRRTQIFVPVIGENWVGRRRFAKPRIMSSSDVLRMEIKTALREHFSSPTDMRILPVLVDGASMPKDSELPREIHDLTRFNAMRVRRDRMRVDVARVVSAIEKELLDREARLDELGEFMDSVEQKAREEGRPVNATFNPSSSFSKAHLRSGTWQLAWASSMSLLPAWLGGGARTASFILTDTRITRFRFNRNGPSGELEGFVAWVYDEPTPRVLVVRLVLRLRGALHSVISVGQLSVHDGVISGVDELGNPCRLIRRGPAPVNP